MYFHCDLPVNTALPGINSALNMFVLFCRIGRNTCTQSACSHKEESLCERRYVASS